MQCRRAPEGGWGNLGDCLTWKQCFDKCLAMWDSEGDSERKCQFVHYEAVNGQCTTFTRQECRTLPPKPSNRRRALRRRSARMRRRAPTPAPPPTWDTIK